MLTTKINWWFQYLSGQAPLADAMWPSPYSASPSAETFLETTMPSWSSGEVKSVTQNPKRFLLHSRSIRHVPTKSLMEDKRWLPAPVSPKLKQLNLRRGARGYLHKCNICTRSSPLLVRPAYWPVYRKIREKSTITISASIKQNGISPGPRLIRALVATPSFWCLLFLPIREEVTCRWSIFLTW